MGASRRALSRGPFWVTLPPVVLDCPWKEKQLLSAALPALTQALAGYCGVACEDQTLRVLLCCCRAAASSLKRAGARAAPGTRGFYVWLGEPEPGGAAGWVCAGGESSVRGCPRSRPARGAAGQRAGPQRGDQCDLS